MAQLGPNSITFSAAVIAVILVAFGGGTGPTQAGSDTIVYVDGSDACAGFMPCYATVQDGVDNVYAPGTVNVFPGTYAESVDLDSMAAPGDIELVTVDDEGTPSPGTATLDPDAAGGPGTGASVFSVASPFPGSITITGFVVTSPDSYGIDVKTGADPISIANVTADGSGDGLGDDDGARLRSSTGSISVIDSSSEGNDDEGFQISSDGDVTINNSSASGNGGAGFSIDGGNVIITGSTANGNSGDGFFVIGETLITITDVTANDNNSAIVTSGNADAMITGASISNNTNEGIHPKNTGNTTVADSFATGTGDDGIDIETDGDATITNSTSTLSGHDGVQIDAGGAVVVGGLTSSFNGQDPAGDGDGVEINGRFGGKEPVDSVSITNSLFIGNDDQAIDFDDSFFELAGPYSVTANIICQNSDGFASDSDVSVDGTANWWGTVSGPTHPSNPGGTGDEVRDGGNGLSGTFDFDPWIDTISGSGGPATEGEPVVVSFEFTDAVVALTDGPGDPNGDSTFSATTDNGTVSTSGFISGGKLQVTLTPDTAGSATVTVEGPCGLDDGAGGNSVVLDVAAAPTEPTPEPTVPAELPETGGVPGGGSGLLWPVLLAGGLALLSGGLAVGRRMRGIS